MKNHVLPWRNTSFQLVYIYLCYTGLIYELASTYWVLTLGPKFKVTKDPLHPQHSSLFHLSELPSQGYFQRLHFRKVGGTPWTLKYTWTFPPWDLGWCWPSNSSLSFKVWFKSHLCHELQVHTAFWQVRFISSINYFVEFVIILITCYHVMETTVLHV